jgi:hypothetical protein
MGELTDKLGKMKAGQLIRSEDWNTLVAAVESGDAKLETHIGQVESSVSGLEAKIAELTSFLAELTAWRQTVEPALKNMFLVTLETSRGQFAMGELGQITARVMDLQGNPIRIDDATIRPWVDFVSTWGQLKPVAGFPSVGGAGDRSVSVQVNQDGVAMVNMRADHAESFTDEQDAEIAATLSTRIPAAANRSMAEIILGEPNPRTVSEIGAFKTMTAEYDRVDTPIFRNYADSYYFRYGPNLGSQIGTSDLFRNRWRDYVATVIAMVKSDISPVTPDQSRGTSSIQVTFRDWLGPWILLDYTVDTGPLRDRIKPVLEAKVTHDLNQSIVGLKEEVVNFVRDKGQLGKQRNYKVLSETLGGIAPAGAPDFLPALSKSMQNAINIQQSVETAQASALGLPTQQVAFEVFSDASIRAETITASAQQSVNQVKGDLANLQLRVEDVKNNLGAVDNKVANLSGRIERTLATGGEIERLQVAVADVDNKVQQLRGLDASRVTTKLSEIEGLTNRMAVLERNLPR